MARAGVGPLDDARDDLGRQPRQCARPPILLHVPDPKEALRAPVRGPLDELHDVHVAAEAGNVDGPLVLLATLAVLASLHPYQQLGNRSVSEIAGHVEWRFAVAVWLSRALGTRGRTH